jgi:hypothetical protein
MNWLQRIAQMPPMGSSLSYNRAAEIVPQVIAGTYDVQQAINELQPEGQAACAFIEQTMVSNPDNSGLTRLYNGLCGQYQQQQQEQQAQPKPMMYPAGTTFVDPKQSEGGK